MLWAGAGDQAFGDQSETPRSTWGNTANIWSQRNTSFSSFHIIIYAWSGGWVFGPLTSHLSPHPLLLLDPPLINSSTREEMEMVRGTLYLKETPWKLSAFPSSFLNFHSKQTQVRPASPESILSPPLSPFPLFLSLSLSLILSFLSTEHTVE